MSIFVRQLGAITCEAKFDRHCNWIVSAIAWNAFSFSSSSSSPLCFSILAVLISPWLLIAALSICLTLEQTKDKKGRERRECVWERKRLLTYAESLVNLHGFEMCPVRWHFCHCGRYLSIHLDPALKSLFLSFPPSNPHLWKWWIRHWTLRHYCIF